jgi:hypothetical protein
VTRPTAAALLLLAAPVALADASLAGRACRSVHLGYPAPDSVAFTIEMTVERSAPGSYFMACGFRMGYFGLQELPDGKKVAIFSVWEPGREQDERQVPEERRVKALAKGPGVRVSRFGNEGTGNKSMLDFDWRTGVPYRFLVTVQPDGNRTAFSGHLYDPATGAWQLMASFSTRADGKRIHGYYSFVEDFLRNGTSATKARSAFYGNGWVRTADGTWHPLASARFTADSNPATNIDASAGEGRFRLATGGDTRNTGVILNGSFALPARPRRHPPTDLPVHSSNERPGRPGR